MSVGQHRHLVVFQSPTASVPDGDGGFTQTWVNLSPASWYVSIEPATARDLERVTSGTVLSEASHVVSGRYHSQLTTGSRIIFGTRVFNVTGVSNPDERNIDMIAICTEQVNAPSVTDTSWIQSGWLQ